MATTQRSASDEHEHRLNAHLTKAGDLLRADPSDNAAEAAEREIQAALKMGPDDVRAKNLLGLLRFRTGKYDEAHAVYRELVVADPEDTGLRLNLGLVELRMAKHADAAKSLREVIAKEPQNTKAQGYLGLALMRSGELPAAYDAFIAAGQTDLAKQVEDQMSSERGAVSRRMQKSEQRITDAVRALENELPTAKVSPPPLPTPVNKIVDSRDGVALRPSLTLGVFVETRELRPNADGPFAIVDDLLVVRVEGRLPMRTVGAVVSSGRLAYAPLARRVRGKIVDESFGEGEEALVAASGVGTIVVAPRGARFTSLTLVNEDVLYLREAVVFAFEETLYWENGRIPGGGAGGLAVVQMRGQGHVVLRSKKAPCTLRVGGGDVLYVDQDALLGWIGQVVPQQLRGVDGEPTQYVSCSGEGALILESPEAAVAASPVSTPAA